jgi:hypothetical protein
MQDKFVKKKWQIKIERWAKNPEEKSKAGCTVGGGDADVYADELFDRSTVSPYPNASPRAEVGSVQSKHRTFLKHHRNRGRHQQTSCPCYETDNP